MSEYQPAPTEMLPDRAQVRTALVIAFLLLASSTWIRLLGEVPLPAFHGFIPVVDAILLVSDLFTATLLFAQASVFRSRAFMALAAGYLFTSLLTITHALTFPGAFASTGLFGAGPSSTAWVSVFWRAGFPLAVGAYALLRPKDRLRLHLPEKGIAASVSAAIVIAVALSMLATSDANLLPPLSVNARHWHYPNLIAATAALIALCLVAMTLLMRLQKSRLDVWLLLSLFAWLVHLVLIAASSERFTLAWYFAFGVGSVSHVIVTLALIAEASRNYARLALSVSELKHERESKLMTMDALTAALAHEVGQPLAAVSMNANAGLLWLTRERPEVEMAIESLRATIDAGTRTTDVVMSIRNAFRKEQGPATQFSLNALIRETASLLHHDFVREKILLQLTLEEALPPILADRTQIQRVLVNLFTNAIESLAAIRDRPRRIAIRSAELDGWQVLLEFSDTGIGLAPDTMAQIFVPFFTTKAKGTGLGLTLCRVIVEDHGGSLWASEDKKDGATFFFRLPHKSRAPGVKVGTYG